MDVYETLTPSIFAPISQLLLGSLVNYNLKLGLLTYTVIDIVS